MNLISNITPKAKKVLLPLVAGLGFLAAGAAMNVAAEVARGNIEVTEDKSEYAKELEQTMQMLESIASSNKANIEYSKLDSIFSMIKDGDEHPFENVK